MIEWDISSLTRNEKDQSVRARDSARALPLQSVAVCCVPCPHARYPCDVHHVRTRYFSLTRNAKAQSAARAISARALPLPCPMCRTRPAHAKSKQPGLEHSEAALLKNFTENFTAKLRRFDRSLRQSKAVA